MNMHRRLSLIHLRPGFSQPDVLVDLRHALQQPALLQATLPGTYNGGDLLLCGAPPPSHPAIAHIDGAECAEGEDGGDWNGGGIYRALLLSLKPGIDMALAARFEREVLAMPRHIRSIRAWRLSRVAQAHGTRPWTHLWEQRYDTLDGLVGPYMLHPYHWAWVDRWFDPESPHWIVDTHLCHSFCNLP